MGRRIQPETEERHFAEQFSSLDILFEHWHFFSTKTFFLKWFLDQFVKPISCDLVAMALVVVKFNQNCERFERLFFNEDLKGFMVLDLETCKQTSLLDNSNVRGSLGKVPNQDIATLLNEVGQDDFKKSTKKDELLQGLHHYWEEILGHQAKKVSVYVDAIQFATSPSLRDAGLDIGDDSFSGLAFVYDHPDFFAIKTKELTGVGLIDLNFEEDYIYSAVQAKYAFRSLTKVVMESFLKHFGKKNQNYKKDELPNAIAEIWDEKIQPKLRPPVLPDDPSEGSDEASDTSKGIVEIDDDNHSEESASEDEAERDDEWAQCSEEDVYAVLDEEQIINLDEHYSNEATVVVVRVARSHKLVDGFVGVRLNWNRHTAEVLLDRLEVWGKIPSMDDYALIYNGKMLDLDTPISDLFPADAPLAKKTFRLKVQKVRGGGRSVKKDSKVVKAQKAVEFKSLLEKKTGAGAHIDDVPHCQLNVHIRNFLTASENNPLNAMKVQIGLLPLPEIEAILETLEKKKEGGNSDSKLQSISTSFFGTNAHTLLKRKNAYEETLDGASLVLKFCFNKVGEAQKFQMPDLVALLEAEKNKKIGAQSAGSAGYAPMAEG